MKFFTLHLRNKRKATVCMTIPLSHPYQSLQVWTKFGKSILEYPMLSYIPILIHSSDCDETFTSCCKHACGDSANLENLKIILVGVPGVALHSDHDEILHTSPSKQEESHCLHDHPLSHSALSLQVCELNLE